VDGCCIKCTKEDMEGKVLDEKVSEITKKFTKNEVEELWLSSQEY
jgi:hypothetical protein